jgi:O-acetyl-ADP-ribose deacetylase (regulator of RNase III)
MRLTIFLHTHDSRMADAWQAEFKSTDGVHVIQDDILTGQADAIVSPANSFGYMDGGIDLAYRKFFGHELQVRLQERIRTQFFGELAVGQATIVSTRHEAFPSLISAPTMRVPDRISDTVNVYLAFRAAIIAVLEHNQREHSPIRSVRVPGLGTGVGGMSPTRAAFQMHAAFDAVLGEPTWSLDPGATLIHHEDLRSR